jgi:carbonic anhydrase
MIGERRGFELIREGVQRFRSAVFSERRELYESLAEKQVPFALFLTCGDSRIDPCLLTGTEPGQIFVERTPGNIVPIYDEIISVGVSASIEYAVAVLGVQDVIVCGHSTCGAMKGLLHPEELKKTPATARWLEYAQPATERLERDYQELEGPERLKRLTQLNVVEQMTHLHTHPAVKERLKSGKLSIHGWFYEIHTGIVEAYEPVTRTFAPWP